MFGKINLIFTLFHHVLIIYSTCIIDQELENIVFCDNGYSVNVIIRVLERKSKRFKELVMFSSSLFPF